MGSLKVIYYSRCPIFFRPSLQKANNHFEELNILSTVPHS